MKKENQEKIRKIYEEEAEISHEIFMDNVCEGAVQYERGFFRSRTLTPMEILLAKCAYCIGIEQGETLECCPNPRCPLYDFMCEKKRRGKPIEH
jgi:hypothetical protein